MNLPGPDGIEELRSLFATALRLKVRVDPLVPR